MPWTRWRSLTSDCSGANGSSYDGKWRNYEVLPESAICARPSQVVGRGQEGAATIGCSEARAARAETLEASDDRTEHNSRPGRESRSALSCSLAGELNDSKWCRRRER